jgi:Fe-coproporphyrin III synthase
MYNLEEFVRNDDAFVHFATSFRNDPSYGNLRCAKIKLTSRCNLRCAMCKYWRCSSGEELSTDQVKKVIQSLQKLKTLKVHFSGGEIFLREDLLEIIDYASSSGLKVNLTTNGTLISRSLARKLINLKTNSISFSLDGPCSKVHDKIRGVKGAFKKIQRGIEFLRQAREDVGGRTRIRINVVLQKKNFRSIPDIIDLAGKLGATEVKVIPVDGKGSGKMNLSKKEIIEYNRDIVPLTIEMRNRHGFSTHNHIIYPLGKEKEQINRAKDADYSLGHYDDHLCFVPWLHTFVAWDGNVYLCCLSRARMEPLGNVLKMPLDGIFRSSCYAEARKSLLQKRFAFCSRCDDFLFENRFLEDHLSLLSSQQ